MIITNKQAKKNAHSASSEQIVLQLIETSGSLGPVADSVKIPSLRDKFWTSLLTLSALAAALYS
jgi:hypothetical protein